MTNPSLAVHQCPTRLDGHAPLIAHAIPGAVCEDHQTARYHKCSSCALARGNEELARRLEPDPVRAPEREVKPTPRKPAVVVPIAASRV